MLKKLIPLGGSILLMACGSSEEPKDKEKTKENARPILIGEISSVHPKQGFVLIKQYGPGEMPTGGLFSARSPDGRRAVGLVPTGEKQGRFHAADFANDAGLPRVGDVVILMPLVEKQAKESPSEEKKLEE